MGRPTTENAATDDLVILLYFCQFSPSFFLFSIFFIKLPTSMKNLPSGLRIASAGSQINAKPFIRADTICTFVQHSVQCSATAFGRHYPTFFFMIHC